MIDSSKACQPTPLRVYDTSVKCQYCGNKAKKVMGDVIYPYRKSLWRKKFFLCEPCDAYVGCHQTPNGKFKSMGELANRELRQLRIKAHEAFDPMWLHGSMERSKAYAWLAMQMNLSTKECHIGKFNVEQCKRVIAICSQSERGKQ